MEMILANLAVKLLQFVYELILQAIQILICPFMRLTYIKHF